MEIEALKNNLIYRKMKEVYYELSHVYKDENEYIKIIGLFSTPKEAWKIIKSLRGKPGFKEHSQKCFWVCRTYIDLAGSWEEGFVFV